MSDEPDYEIVLSYHPEPLIEVFDLSGQTSSGLFVPKRLARYPREEVSADARFEEIRAQWLTHANPLAEPLPTETGVVEGIEGVNLWLRHYFSVLDPHGADSNTEVCESIMRSLRAQIEPPGQYL